MSTAGRLPPHLSDLVSVPRFLGSRPTLARPLEGTTPSGAAVFHDLHETWTLLLFLSTSCEGCHELWAAVSDPIGSVVPAGVRTVLVTRGPGTEGADVVARLGGDAAVVMSDEAWTDYEVHGGPFFALVDGTTGRIASEGVAWSIEQIVGAITAAGVGG